jgi:hypothetical protein
MAKKTISRISLSLKTEGLADKDSRFKNALNDSLKKSITVAINADKELIKVINSLKIDLSDVKDKSLVQVIENVKSRVDARYHNTIEHYLSKNKPGKDPSPKVNDLLGLEKPPSANPLLADAMLNYNAARLGEVIKMETLSTKDELPLLLNSSNDKKVFLLKQWQKEKKWKDDDVRKIENTLSLMRIFGDQSDVVTTLWNAGVKRTSDLAGHNIESLANILKEGKVGTDQKVNAAFAEAVLNQAEQEHPSAFFMYRVVEKPDWLGLDATDRPTISNEFRNFYSKNKEFDLRSEPVISLETGQLNKKITGVTATPALIKELSAAQQALLLSPDTDIAALLLAKKVNIHKAATDTHKRLMRELDIDSPTAIQIKQKAQYYYSTMINGFLAYRDVITNPFLKNPLNNLAPARDEILDGLGKKDNWETIKQTNGLKGLTSIEELFGPQNYCECISCQSVLSPAAYFVDLMSFIENKVLQQPKSSLTETILPDTHPIHLKVRRPDLWKLKLNCENTDKRIPYIEIINEVLTAFIEKQLGTSKSITRRLSEELPGSEFLLPYDPTLDVLRTWLSFFGLKRTQVLEYLYPDPNDDEILELAIEYLNLSKVMYENIINKNLAASIDKDVLAFRRKSGLTAEETEQLVTMKFWIGKLAIKKIKDSSDIQKFNLEFDTMLSNWQGHMHRLIRIWKATGWPLAALDNIFQAFSITFENLDKTAILNLAAFKKLQQLSGFDEDVLVGFLKGLPVIKTTQSKISWEQLLPKTWKPDADIKLGDLVNNTDDDVVKLLLDLQGIFGINYADILACLTFLKDKIGKEDPIRIKFNSDTLNIIFRYIQVYKWSKVDSFDTFRQLLKVWGKGEIKSFDNPLQDITAFIEYKHSFEKLGFTAEDLILLFGEESIVDKINEEDKKYLESIEIIELIKQDDFKSPDHYSLLFNKWLGIEKEVLGYFKNFLEKTDAKLDELFVDIKKPAPADKTFIQLTNIKKRLECLVFMFDKFKIDVETQKSIAKAAKSCVYPKLNFTTWESQSWIKEIAYLANWIDETRDLKNFSLFNTLEHIEKDAPLSINTFKAVAKWQKMDLSQVQNTVVQSNSISKIQSYFERLAWTKYLNINCDMLNKLKLDVPFEVQIIILQNAIRSKYDNNETWESAIKDFKNKLSSNLRDALCNFVIFNKDLRDKNFNFKDWESLYQYFLLDVGMGECFTLPRIVAATNSLQVYIHRCIMGLERSDDEKISVLLDIDEIQEWEWRKNYRVFEANRRIFLFPELYVEPEIRDNKSPEFKELEDELLQQKLNLEVVENAFKKYLQQLMILAELRMAGAYFDKAFNRIYLFGKTNKQPVEYYYRYLEFLNNGGVFWSNWEKVNIAIPADDISAIRHNGKLHIFWTNYQRKDISSIKSGNSNIAMHTYDVFLNYSYLKVDKKWSAPQRIEMGYRTNSPFDPFLRIARYNDEVSNSDTPNPTLNPEAEQIRENVLKEFEQTVYRKPYPIWAYDQNYLNLNYIWTDKKDALTPQYKHSRAMIDAFTVSVRVVLKIAGLKVEGDLEYSFDRYDKIVNVATSSSQTQEPANIIIPSEVYHINLGIDLLYFELSFNQDSQGTYHYSFHTKSSAGNEMFFFKEDNKEMKSGDVDILHQIDYVPVSKIEYKTETVDMARQKRVLKKFNSDLSVGNIHRSELLSMVAPNLINVSNYQAVIGSVIGVTNVTSAISGAIIGGIVTGGNTIMNKNSLASEYNAYYDGFCDFFVTDGTENFADGYQDYKIQQRDAVSILTTPTNSDPNKGYKLNPEHIKHLWDKISIGIDNLLDTQTQNQVAGQIDYSKSFGNYFYELFFHIPMRIADHLNAAGKYREANHWYSYIFNPTAIKDKFEQLAFPNDVNWRFTAFRNIGIQKLKEIYNDPNTIEMYQRNPGNPHAIARLRIGAYQKNVVMKYLDNLMDWGDYLYEQYTPESSSEARYLYNIVKSILGNKPESTGKCKEEVIDLTYDSVKSGVINDFIYNLFAVEKSTVEEKQELNAPVGIANNVSSHMVAMLSNSINKQAKYRSQKRMLSSEVFNTKFGAVSGGSKAELLNPNITSVMLTRPIPFFNLDVDLVFCFPHNKDFIKYWDRVDERIYNLNHCLDINGVPKLMPAYSPEINPALLAQMVAGGLSFDEIATALNAKMPNHRFIFLIEKAKQFCSVVQGFGGALFAAIEKKDGEELTLLRARHEQNILTLTTQNKKKQLEQAKTHLQTLLENKKGLEIRKTHYESLIEEGLIPWENAEQIAKWTAGGLRIGENVFQIVAAISALVPQVGSPFAMKYGGVELSGSSAKFAGSLDAIAKMSDNIAMLAGLEASHQRREQEWQFQVKTYTQELVSMEQQIRNAEIALRLAELDLDLHTTNIEQYKELYEYYTTKFSDYKHYTFQVRQLQQLFRMAFNLANDMAIKAQQAFDFERHDVEGITTGYIRSDNWNNEKLGLLAGERLMIQLMQLEKEFIDTDKRRKEITQHFSMLQLAPDKLLDLKINGECSGFIIPEAAFNLTYPGYYRRIIKSVRISIPCITGPYINIGATLTLGNNKIRATKDTGLQDYNFTGCETIATSNAQNDGGQYELNFRDERFLPFEGAGAVESAWTLSLPKEVRSFDYNTISDVIFHISYTAEYNGGFKTNVENNLKATLNALNGVGLSRAFSVRTDFPAEWHKLNSSDNAADVILTILREHFPYFANPDQIKSIGKVFVLSNDNLLKEETGNHGISKSGKMKVTVPLAIGRRNLKDVIFLVTYTCS